MLWEYYNKARIYPIFCLLQGDYRERALAVKHPQASMRSYTPGPFKRTVAVRRDFLWGCRASSVRAPGTFEDRVRDRVRDCFWAADDGIGFRFGFGFGWRTEDGGGEALRFSWVED